MRNKLLLWHIIIVAIISPFVVGGIIYWSGCFCSNTPNFRNNELKFNCEQSGGMFAKTECQCQVEPKVNGASAFSYDQKSGWCVDTTGLPGGEIGEKLRQ